MIEQEKINVCIIDPSELEWLKQQNIGEIAGIISFGDSYEFQKIIDYTVPAIFSHSGYWTDEGRYVDSSEQGPLQVFFIQNAKSVNKGVFKDIKYSESEEYIIGSIEIKEPDNGNGNDLANVAEDIYNNIHELLQKTGKKTLIRVGNYVTDILSPISMIVDGIEVITNRYKAFCVGRSISMEKLFDFKDTKQMPTATGIGNHFNKRSVKIFFIATNRSDVENHQNPYQTNPAEYSANQHGIPQLHGQLSLPKFSRATTLSKYSMLFVGGTASIIGQEVVHEGNIVKQTKQALQNIKYTMEEAQKNTGLKFTDLPIILKVFVKNKNDYDAIKMTINSKEHNPLENVIIDEIYTHGDICREQRLVEISCETMDYETAGLILQHKREKTQKDERKILHKLFKLGYGAE